MHLFTCRILSVSSLLEIPKIQKMQQNQFQFVNILFMKITTNFKIKLVAYKIIKCVLMTLYI